jgi:molybdopterin-guanine dinucleotide biosynthesis protein B
VDQPGKDSHSHRMAGATEVMVASAARFALIHELRGAAEPTLQDLLKRMAPVDLIIVEGYKAAAVPKLEVHRAAVGKPLLHPDDDCIVAVASDVPLAHVELPVVSLDDVGKITDIVALESAPVERVLAAQGRS